MESDSFRCDMAITGTAQTTGLPFLFVPLSLQRWRFWLEISSRRSPTAPWASRRTTFQSGNITGEFTYPYYQDSQVSTEGHC
jgi:hypothetical protein